MIVSNVTLLFQGDYDPSKNQYCGIVTSLNNDYFVNVRWYKWGYTGPDFMDVIEFIPNVEKWTVPPTHLFFWNHGLPPIYRQPLVYNWTAIHERIDELLKEFADARDGDWLYTNRAPEDVAAEAKAYVEKLLRGYIR